MSELAYGRAIDNLVSSAMRPDRAHASTAQLDELHAAGASIVDEPMPLAAARLLLGRVEAGDKVLLLTGVYDPITLPFGETDGPPGVATLARALDLGFSAKPVVVCEGEVTGGVELCCLELGLLPVHDAGHFAAKAHTVLVLPFPIVSAEESARHSEAVVGDLEPRALVSVERKGRNSAGRYHNAAGQSRTTEARVDYLVDAVQAAGGLTIGIGDGGNEIGMGNIRDAVQDILPYGRVCQCDCGEGIAPIGKTDLLVVANTANLGAYGVAASLAMLLGKPELLHDARAERYLLRAVAAAKCMDAGFVSPSVDGTGQISIAIVDLLQAVAHFACANG